MEESLLDVTANSADTDCEERPVNGYGSPIASRSIGNVGETSQVPSSRVVSCEHNTQITPKIQYLNIKENINKV